MTFYKLSESEVKLFVEHRKLSKWHILEFGTKYGWRTVLFAGMVIETRHLHGVL